jgi:hypothetical protein
MWYEEREEVEEEEIRRWEERKEVGDSECREVFFIVGE